MMLGQDGEDTRAPMEMVFTHTWRGVEPGTGSEYVVRAFGAYYAVMSVAGRMLGPYAGLWQAVEALGLEEIKHTTVSLECTELPANEVATHLRTKEGPGHRFTINGEPWVIGPGQRIVPLG